MNIYTINLQTAGVWLFESSLVQLRSNEDLEGPECSNYSQSCERCKLLAATLVDKQSGHTNKVKEHNIQSICRQQLLGSLRAHQYSSDQMKILKDRSAETTPLYYIYIYICMYLGKVFLQNSKFRGRMISTRKIICQIWVSWYYNSTQQVFCKPLYQKRSLLACPLLKYLI